MIESNKKSPKLQNSGKINQIYIPDLNQYTEKLQNSKEAFRLLFEQSVDGIIIIVDGKIEMANPAFCNIYGATIDEIIGCDPLKLVHPDYIEIAKKRIGKFLHGEIDVDPNSAFYKGLNADV